MPDYDRTRPLVIDPVPHYLRYVGGSGADRVTAIVPAAQGGGVYVAGGTASADLPPGYQGPGVDGSQNGGQDAFVALLDGNGSVASLTYRFVELPCRIAILRRGTGRAAAFENAAATGAEPISVRIPG